MDSKHVKNLQIDQIDPKASVLPTTPQRLTFYHIFILSSSSADNTSSLYLYMVQQNATIENVLWITMVAS